MVPGAGLGGGGRLSVGSGGGEVAGGGRLRRGEDVIQVPVH